ncbi:uncharacterized protein LOC117300681 [Asterias rubens]|uniref:uncharacterized protein LOC117300681 n=1 Tax=Asterias rubens TaxID=7604 RepID=UPI001454F117|nr:uncharacterized protein LOC117300681 [Asterias rubens]
MASASKKESVNRNLRSVLITEKAGVALNRLQGEYQALLGETIPFKEFGFPSLEAYLKSIPAVVSIRRGPTGEMMCAAVADETTKHIASLVSRQKGKKSRGRGIRSKPGRSYAHPTYAMSKARPAGKLYTSRFVPKTGRSGRYNTSFKPAAAQQPKPVRYNHTSKPAYTHQTQTVKYNPIRPKETTAPKPLMYTQQARPTASQQSRPTAFQQSRPTASQHSRPTASQQSRPTAGQQSRPTGSQQSRPTAAQQSRPAGYQHSRSTEPQQFRPTAAQESRPTAAQKPTAAEGDTKPLVPTATTQLPNPGPWSGKLGSKKSQQPAKTTTVGTTQSSTWKPADDWSATNGLSSSSKPIHENIHVTIPNDGARQVNSQASKPVHNNIHVTVSNNGYRQTEVSPQKPNGRPGKPSKPEWSSNFEVPPRFKRLVSPTGTINEGFHNTRESSLNSDPSPNYDPTPNFDQSPPSIAQQPSSTSTNNVLSETANETYSWIQTVLGEKPNGLWASALCDRHLKEFGQPLDTDIIEQMNKLSLLEKESIANSDILYPKLTGAPTVTPVTHGRSGQKNNAEHGNQTGNGTPQSCLHGNTSTKPFDHTKPVHSGNLFGANLDIALILRNVCKRQNLPVEFYVDSTKQPGKSAVCVICTAGTDVATAHGLTIGTAKQAAAGEILQQWNVAPSDLGNTPQVSPDECVQSTTDHDYETQLQNEKIMKRLRRFGPADDLKGSENLFLREEHVKGFCSCFGGRGTCPFQIPVSPEDCMERAKAYDEKAQEQNEKLLRRLKRFGPIEDISDEEKLYLRVEHVGGFCSCFSSGHKCPFQIQISQVDGINRSKETVQDEKARLQNEKLMMRLKRFGPTGDLQNHPRGIFSSTRSEDKFCVLNSGKPDHRRATPAVEGKSDFDIHVEEETINHISCSDEVNQRGLSEPTSSATFPLAKTYKSFENPLAPESRRATDQEVRQALKVTFGKTAIYETVKHMGTKEDPLVSVCFMAGAFVGIGRGGTKTEARKAALEDLLKKQGEFLRVKSELQEQAAKGKNAILQESLMDLSLDSDEEKLEVKSEPAATVFDEVLVQDEQVVSVKVEAGSVTGLQTQAYLPPALPQNGQLSPPPNMVDSAEMKPVIGPTRQPSHGRGYTRWQVDPQYRSNSSPRLPEEDTPSEGYSSPTLGVPSSLSEPSSRPPSTVAPGSRPSSADSPSTLGEPCEEGYSSPTSETLGSSSEPSYEGSYSTIDAPGVPSLVLPEEKEWDLYVAYIKSLSDFYAILIGDDYSEQMIIMEEAMRSFYQCSTWVLTEPPEVGVCYAAEFNREWLRVQVTSVEDEQVKCFLLDHGDTESATITSLRPLAEKFLQLPFQVIHCKLSQCEQVAHDDKTALQMFCQLALGKSLLAEVVSRDGDRIEMELFDSSDVSILEQCSTAGI